MYDKFLIHFIYILKSTKKKAVLGEGGGVGSHLFHEQPAMEVSEKINSNKFDGKIMISS